MGDTPARRQIHALEKAMQRQAMKLGMSWRTALSARAKALSPRITLVAAALVVVLAAWGALQASGRTSIAPHRLRADLSPTLPKARLTMGGHPFRVDLAESPSDQSRGLGGRKALRPDEGMLFIYRDPGQPSFWMHGMVIAIDMLWIDNDQIVYIVRRAPPPAPGTPDDALPVYTPDKPANFVLEIAAGRAQELGVKVGDRVQFDFSAK
jgi:uncharacterized protein